MTDDNLNYHHLCKQLHISMSISISEWNEIRNHDCAYIIPLKTMQGFPPPLSFYLHIKKDGPYYFNIELKVPTLGVLQGEV